MSEYNVSLSKCSCCETGVLYIKEELLRKTEEQTTCRGRISIADLSPQDVIDLYQFCELHLDDLGIALLEEGPQ